jgi:hypothetical protein
MTSPSMRATIPISWSIQRVVLPRLSLPIARLTVPLFLGLTPSISQGLPELAWLDTGAPLSVVPLHIHGRGLVWQRLGVRSSWSGQPCDLGRIDIWLPTDQPPYLHGPFSLLAKFPRSDPPGSPIPLLLGLEFLLTYQTEFHLLCPPQQGTLMLP